MNPLKEKSALLEPSAQEAPTETKPLTAFSGLSAPVREPVIDTDERKIGRRGMMILLFGFGGFMLL